MSQTLIDDSDVLAEFCDAARAQGVIAFDTEFISEFTYRPDLCLLQLATRDDAIIVDPIADIDLSSFWALTHDADMVKVVHGGREEVRFCLSHAGRPPVNLVDVQIAEGLRGRTFPLGYEALVKRVLNKRVHGRETRTDWRRRPLSPAQIEYAVEDVKHLLPIWDRQRQSLGKQGRLDWAAAEFQRMIDEVVAERGEQAWQRLPGIGRLNREELNLVRALYWWRDGEAAAKNRPVRKVLRDDLLVDIAKRRPVTQAELLATRDMQRSDFKKYAGDMLECIERARETPRNEWPQELTSRHDDASQDEQIIGQFLGLALANHCADRNVAVSLVGTMSDLRDLVRWVNDGRPTSAPPRLARDWRSDFCGDLLSEVLAGRMSIRVADPSSDHPLVFERSEPAS